MDHERFYARRGIGPDDHKLSVPDSLGDSLDRVARLAPGQKRDLIRACFWLNHARRVWTISQSASYLAVSQAIEALLPDAEQIKCEECGELREVPSITKRFTDWVEANVPDEEARSSLYASRSKITHGSILLEVDVQALPDSLTPRGTEQDLALRIALEGGQLGASQLASKRRPIASGPRCRSYRPQPPTWAARPMSPGSAYVPIWAG